MISKELLDWVKRQVALIDEKFKDGLTTKNEAIFAQIVKLAEEVGELSSEILGMGNLQRDRGVKNTKTHLQTKLPMSYS